jgi:hypothetical protein
MIAAASWTIYKWGWQFFVSEALDEANVPFFGAFVPGESSVQASTGTKPAIDHHAPSRAFSR